MYCYSFCQSAMADLLGKETFLHLSTLCNQPRPLTTYVLVKSRGGMFWPCVGGASDAPLLKLLQVLPSSCRLAQSRMRVYSDLWLRCYSPPLPFMIRAREMKRLMSTTSVGTHIHKIE